MDTLNFNIGMLGHVDSGKTSLAKALSTVSSTAAFDKNPQSKERGITLDLGFSSFSVTMPEHLTGTSFTKLQYTLVDCPGHASLIRTIIGGAQIIDLMVLVVDINKGIQTQTAECLVIGEIICDKMLVVLNKVDLIQEQKRKSVIEKMTKRIEKTLEKTKFRGSLVTTVSANPGGSSDYSETPQGVDKLIEVFKENTYIPRRSPDGPFIFSVDHCFSIKGQGTVMTGTVLSGKVKISDSIEISSLQTTKKVKSMQMFHHPVQSVQQGDRAGLCVTQFDPKLLERGLICTPGSLPTLYAAIVSISKIAYFSGDVATKSKFHVTVGHSTVMAKVALFASTSPSKNSDTSINGGVEKIKLNGSDGFDFARDYIYQEDLKVDGPQEQWALLEFEKPVVCRKDSLLIGSRFDSDIHANKCRLAFKAQIVEAIDAKDYATSVLPRIKVFKYKSRSGIVERVHDDYNVICKGLVKKETNIALFSGLHVKLSTGESGIIDSSFGMSGKVKIRIPDRLKPETKASLGGVGKGKKKKKEAVTETRSPSDAQVITVTMDFKRYVYDPTKKMKQT